MLAKAVARQSNRDKVLAKAVAGQSNRDKVLANQIKLNLTAVKLGTTLKMCGVEDIA